MNAYFMTPSENDPERVSEDELGDSTAPAASQQGRSADPSSPAQHADKYNDPRAKITARGIWIGVGVLIFGILGAAGSIYQRKTKLEQTRRFWGDETVLALQLAERIRMESVCGRKFKTVELTATPGLGHLRHALLDERSYRWDSTEESSIMEHCSETLAGGDNHKDGDNRKQSDGEAKSCIRLVLTDPTAHRFSEKHLIVDLTNGWVGPEDGSRRVQTTQRVRPALAKFLTTLINVQQKRYDLREASFRDK